MSEIWRQGGKVPHHVYRQRGDEPDRSPWPHGDPPIGMFLTPEDARRAVDAVNSAARLRGALAELVRLKDGPRDESYGAAKHAAWGTARAVLANPAPMYPDTKFLTLCTLEGRRVGAVTIGESRLPVVDVLALIRAHGVGEAQLMWPQLTDDEIAVLERLVADLDARGEEGDDD